MKSTLAALLVFLFSPLVAQGADFEALAELAAQTRADLTTDKLPQLDASRTAMRQSIDEVDAYLQRTATASIRDGWLDYLLVSQLRDALDSGEREGLQELAERIQGRLSATYPGLERDPVMRFRAAASRLADAAQFGQESVLPAIERQLTQLEQVFQQMEPVPSALNAAGAARIVTILERTGQADRLVAAVRQRFAEPNFRLHLSDAFVSESVHRPVYEHRPVNQVILGTRLIGTSSLTGDVSARLIPNENHAAIEILLSGCFTSATTGYNRKVQVHTRSQANVTAASTVLLDQEGIARTPSSVSGKVDSTLCGVSHPLRIVRRIAARRAAEQQPLAERIATQRLHRQLADSFNSQLSDALDNNSEEALEKTGTYFDRLGLPRPEQRWWTDRQFIHLYARQRGPGQLAAVTSPPMPEATRFLSVQIHESAVDNAGASVLSGRKLDNEELRDILIGAGIPADSLERELDDEGNPIEQTTEITFADFRPVVFEARDNTVRIGLRGTQFSDGEREVNRPLEIAATYDIARENKGAVLQRQGDIEVNFAGLRRLGVTEIAIKRSILRRFDTVFPPALFDEPLELPQRVADGRELHAEDITAGDGWLTIHFR